MSLIEEALKAGSLNQVAARSLGYFSFGTAPVSLYQDAASALHDQLVAQRLIPEGAPPKPSFFSSPVFVAGSPKVLALPNGNLKITIPNAATYQTVLEALKDDRHAAAFQVSDTSAVSPLPIQNAKAAAEAFGTRYEGEVLGTAHPESLVFTIPVQSLPQQVLTLLKNPAGAGAGSDELLNLLGPISLSYSFLTQSLPEDACRLAGSPQDLVPTYTRPQHCPPEAGVEEFTDGLAQVHSNKGSTAADSVNSKLATIMGRGQIVTRCSALHQAQIMQQRAGLACSKPFVDPIAPKVATHLESTVTPLLVSHAVEPHFSSSWSDETWAAIIRMFGSPERFVSLVQSLNYVVGNKTGSELENDDYDHFAWLFETLRDHDVLGRAGQFLSRSGEVVPDDLQSTSSNSVALTNLRESRWVNGLVETKADSYVTEVLTSMSTRTLTAYAQNLKATDAFKAAYNAFHETAHALALTGVSTDTETDLLRLTSQHLFAMGIDHTIERVNGNIQIFPRINLVQRTEAGQIEASARPLASTELGTINRVSASIPVLRAEASPAQVVFRFQCSDNPASWVGTSAWLETYEWWKRPSFWQKLSDNATAAILQDGCNRLAIKMWYRGAEQNPGAVPDMLRLNMKGMVRKSVAATGGAGAGAEAAAYWEPSRPISIEVNSAHDEASPATGTIQLSTSTLSRISRIVINTLPD